MPNFTKQAIKASFIKLLEERPLNKISVKDIVEDCGVNRNSFYYHFQDIPALIEEIMTEAADNLIRKYPSIGSVEECFHAAFQFAVENKRVILHVFHSINRDIYEKYLMQFCEYIVATYLDTVFGETQIQETDRNTIICFLKCELFGISIEWAANGMPSSAIEQLERFLFLSRGLSAEIIRRCSQSGRD